MNGDGLPDRVRYSDTTEGLKVAFNNGTGFQGEQNWENVGSRTAVVYYNKNEINNKSKRSWNSKECYFTDVTGDGLPDRIEVEGSGGRSEPTTKTDD